VPFQRFDGVLIIMDDRLVRKVTSKFGLDQDPEIIVPHGDRPSGQTLGASTMESTLAKGRISSRIELPEPYVPMLQVRFHHFNNDLLEDNACGCNRQRP
jgi:hypothetical protein